MLEVDKGIWRSGFCYTQNIMITSIIYTIFSIEYDEGKIIELKSELSTLEEIPDERFF